MEGWDKTNKGEEDEKDSTKAQEVREQATNEPTDGQVTRRNRGVAQPRWMEKPETTTPPCKKQREMRK
jgi:hypothetical protein